MKYSIGGSIFTSDETEIIEVINKYIIWKLTINTEKDNVTNMSASNFEVWVNAETDKSDLFEELKRFVYLNGGHINWHECRHDEIEVRPCVISEEYRGA